MGEILDLTFRIYRGTLVKCLSLASFAVVIAQLPNVYFLLSGRGLKQSFLVLLRDPLYATLLVVGVVVAAVLDAAVLLRQYKLSSAGEPGGELAAAVRRAPALVSLGLLFSLALLACLAPAWLFPVPLRWGLVVLLALPASYLFVSLLSSLPVLLLSGASPVASLARSWRLTRRSFWRLTAVYTVATVILVVLYILLGTATGFIVALAAHGDLAMVTATSTVTGIALGAFTRPLYTALQLAVLGDLTARREGTDLAQRISAAA